MVPHEPPLCSLAPALLGPSVKRFVTGRGAIAHGRRCGRPGRAGRKSDTCGARLHAPDGTALQSRIGRYGLRTERHPGSALPAFGALPTPAGQRKVVRNVLG